MGSEMCIRDRSTNAKTYVTQITKKIEDLMETSLRHYTHPLDPKYHPELDEGPFLVGDNISKYRTMVGSLNWLVTLGRHDIMYSANTLHQIGTNRLLQLLQDSNRIL